MARTKKDATAVEETVKKDIAEEAVSETTTVSENAEETVKTEVSDDADKIQEKADASVQVEVTDYEAEQFAAPENPSRSDVLREKLKKENERSEKNAKREATLSLWEQFKNAQFEKRILTGTIIGVDTIKDNNVAIIMMNGFRILVPYAGLYESDPIDTSTVRSQKDRSKRELQMMRRMFNAEIPFIIEHIEGNPMDNDGYAILASRQNAIKRIAAVNFDKRRNKKPHIAEGDIVDASVVSVGLHGVFVNVYGKDISIPMYKLTYKYIENCREFCKTGDKIKVCIDKIEYDEHGKATAVDISAKKAEEMEYISRIDAISEEMICMGRVTSIQQDRSNPSKVRAYLFLEGWDIPAVVDHIRFDVTVKPLQQGDKILFRVKWKDLERGRVRGNIISKF